ncbi:Trk/Ktr/HKT type cation transporter, partial [Lecanoromycetidae sp. Uapishka_2]
MYIIPLSDVAPALLVLYTWAMFVSGLPILVSIRSTNVYEERSIGIERPGNSEKDDEKKSEKSYIGTHLQKQLAGDVWWVIIPFFLICIIERTGLAIPSQGFDLYAILFDTVSAFGTVGLSTGVPYDTYSFCGAWHTLSKLILIVVMVRGRHRGLPMAIDRAVLLPGQELMERMDKEYNDHPSERHMEEERETVRRDESGGNAETEEKGQDPEQNEETARKMHLDSSQEDMAQTA